MARAHPSMPSGGARFTGCIHGREPKRGKHVQAIVNTQFWRQMNVGAAHTRHAGSMWFGHPHRSRAAHSAAHVHRPVTCHRRTTRSSPSCRASPHPRVSVLRSPEQHTAQASGVDGVGEWDQLLPLMLAEGDGESSDAGAYRAPHTNVASAIRSAAVPRLSPSTAGSAMWGGGRRIGGEGEG